MKPNDFGRRLGIGVRIAGRMAADGARKQAASPESPATPGAASHGVPIPPASMPGGGPAARPQGGSRSQPEIRAEIASAQTVAREIRSKAPAVARATGRGVGGFIRPFSRVGGILWLEVTGFFFGLVALYFASDVWRIRQNYRAGPEHTHFLLSCAIGLVFLFFCVSSFWRAGRK